MSVELNLNWEPLEAKIQSMLGTTLQIVKNYYYHIGLDPSECYLDITKRGRCRKYLTNEFIKRNFVHVDTLRHSSLIPESLFSLNSNIVQKFYSPLGVKSYRDIVRYVAMDLIYPKLADITK